MTTSVEQNTTGECTGRRRDLSGVAYLLQNFPKYSETFILNELLEHQNLGSPVRVIALRLPRDGRFHGCLAELNSAAEYIPESYWEKPDKRREATWDALRHAPGGLLQAVRRQFGRQVDFRDLWQAVLVRRWARRRNIAHIHVHFGGYAARVAFLSRLMGGPSYSVTLHAFDIFRENVNQALLRDMIAASCFCVTVSEFNARYLRERILADTSRIRVLYNGIPLSRFPFGAASRNPGTILTVGRLIEKKGFIHLVRACGILAAQGETFRCDIVGEGPMKDEIKTEIANLNLKGRVNLVGAWPQERVAEALRTASVFALPCIEAADGNMDALPTVLLEAMAAGCPCVSTNLSGIPEIIRNRETGLLVEPGDEPGLATAIREILQNRDAAARYSLAGRARAEAQFDIQKAIGVLAEWLDQAAHPTRVELSDAGATADRRPPLESLGVTGEILA